MKKNEHLDLTSLKKVRNALERATAVYERFVANKVPDDELEVTKAGIIQHFEFSYELSWKFMKRWLSMNIASNIVDGVTRRSLFRTAAENNLIDDVEQWMMFHEARNSSSHTYDQVVADEILAIALQFLPYLNTLIERLEERSD